MAVATTGRDWRSRSTVTLDEVAPILGVGRSTAYNAAKTGDIPTIRVGKRILVPVAALRRMLGEIASETGNAPAG
jgi:excisionase family DNA binding protein